MKRLWAIIPFVACILILAFSVPPSSVSSAFLLEKGQYAVYRLPYSHKSSVKWTGGPHPIFGSLTGEYTLGTGSGIDFAGPDDQDDRVKKDLLTMYAGKNLTYGSTNFRVLAMAGGTVKAVRTTCPDDPTYKDFGCWIAIEEPAYHTVIIYAHLLEGSIRFTTVGQTVAIGEVIALAGSSGKQFNDKGERVIHLHIDLHLGTNFSCTTATGNPSLVADQGCYWGTPLGWESYLGWLDQYLIWGYYSETNSSSMMNYDGSAVYDPNHTITGKTISHFPYIKGSSQRYINAVVAPDFPNIGTAPNYNNPPCVKSGSNSSCEYNYTMGTQFAVENGYTGWAVQPDSSGVSQSLSGNQNLAPSGNLGSTLGILLSSNVPITPALSSLPTSGGAVLPANGVELCSAINYGGPCALYSWNTNDACINLSASGMNNTVESVRFLGDYNIYDYEVVMYDDNLCSVYNARLGSDATTLNLLNNVISSMRIEKHNPPLTPGGGRIELYDGTSYSGDLRSYTWSSNSLCIDLNSSGMSDRSESIRFFDWYISNFDVIFYNDNTCQQYYARYGEETTTFGNLNNQYSSMRIEQHGTLNPNGTIRLYDSTSYGGTYYDYRYQNNDKCIDLNPSGMSDRSESIKLMDYYVGNFDAILYGDNACQVYLARFGEESPNFGGLNNQFSSMRIEKHAYLVPDGTLELCDGENFSGQCQSYRYTSDGHCFNLSDSGMSDRSKSVRFRSGYVGEFDTIFYNDNACQTYNARYGQDTSTFGNLNSQFSSMRLEHHGPIVPDLTPSPISDQSEPVTISSQAGNNSPTLTSGQPVYITWGYKNTGVNSAGDHFVDLFIDNLNVLHQEYTTLASQSQNGQQALQVSSFITPGWHQIQFFVDSQSQVSEANETNNQWTGMVYWNAVVSQTTSQNRIFVPITVKNPPSTLTLFPISDVEIGSVDCISWDQCKAANYGNFYLDGFTGATIGTTENQSGHYDIKRIYTAFDTSLIPPGATILSAELHLYIGPFINGESKFHIVQANTNLPFTYSTFGSAVMSSGGSATLAANTWVTVPLDSNVYNWIKKGGTTTFALIHDKDLNNQMPSSTNDMLLSMAEDSHVPFFVVKYTQ